MEERNPPAPSIVFCTQCGKQYPAEQRFCARCGAALSRNFGAKDIQPLSCISQIQSFSQEEPEGVTLHRELSIFIGENSLYYLSVFQKLDQKQRFLSWNWPAFYFGPLWFLYRKMYRWGIIFALVTIITFFTPYGIADFFLCLCSGALGNYLYKRHTQRSLSQARQFPEKYWFLLEKSGISLVPVLLFMLLRLVVMLAPVLVLWC